jgi:translation initiation factor 2B subunit (eIF-2B alpha/beta/delta family)
MTPLPPALRTHLSEALSFLVQDRSHGAVELARIALDCLRDLAERGLDRDGLCAAAGRLATARPSMAPVPNLLDCCRARLVLLATADPAACLEVIRALARDLELAGRELVERTADDLQGVRSVMTHSYSSTVASVIEGLRPPGGVVLTESRPLCEGRALAERLVERGVDVTLISDAQMALAVGGVDCVLVGCDRITRCGAVVNKAGTSLLAMAAGSCGVPFHVVGESLKLDRLGGEPPELEEMPAAELGVEPGPSVTSAIFGRPRGSRRRARVRTV